MLLLSILQKYFKKKERKKKKKKTDALLIEQKKERPCDVTTARSRDVIWAGEAQKRERERRVILPIHPAPSPLHPAAMQKHFQEWPRIPTEWVP